MVSRELSFLRHQAIDVVADIPCSSQHETVRVVALADDFSIEVVILIDLCLDPRIVHSSREPIGTVQPPEVLCVVVKLKEAVPISSDAVA